MKCFRFVILALFSSCLVIFTTANLPIMSQQKLNTEFNLPMRLAAFDSTNATQALLPDWQRISFGSLPPIQESGTFTFAGKTRTWKVGQTPDQYLTLADIQTALKPDLLNLANIVKGLDLKTIAINSFPLLGEQTLKHLVDIVPSLGNFSANQVPPIAALLQNQGLIVDSNSTLADLLTQNPTLGELKLNEIDLSAYTIGDIPQVESVQLGQFQGWSDTLIADVPALNALPLSEFPLPLTQLGQVFARIDFIWGKAEQKRWRTISGSDVAGFSVPCQGQDCPYIELDDLENSGRTVRGEFEGRSWISGKYQQVEGGWGCLKFVNGGQEPTGRLPFGSAFKVVVMEPDETTDTVDTALYFRFQNFCGATPYFIGPVPFLTYRVNAPIFIGTLDSQQMRATSVPQTSTTSEALATSSPPVVTPDEPCPTVANSPAGVNVAALKSAIASVESSGQPDAIGPYVCADGGRNCGRALGKYQDMSYNPYAVQAIVNKPGGQAWLNQLNSGATITPAELFQFYPPADQEAAMKAALLNKITRTTSEIDPTTGLPFAGERLIERIAQKHFGGDASLVDGQATDVFGRLSLKSYGLDVLRRYKERANLCKS
ncbi:M23 family peptidase [Phormidium sp. LEGE 05292]|nr:M23 family peptidase [Phormidium sp. LEGE 05292]